MMKHLVLVTIILMNVWVMHSKMDELTEAGITDSILENFKDKPKKEVFKVYHYLYKKDYDLNSEEGLKRYKIFKQNLRIIEETNSINLSYKLKIGPFTDLTNEEFKETYLMKTQDLKKIMDEESKSPYSKKVDKISDFDLGQTKFDWTSTFRPAQSQGRCGSCWAFATVAALEGNYQKNFRDYLAFSPQQLVDCDSYNAGCNGGWPTYSLRYVKEKGVIYENAYPYISGVTNLAYNCQYSQNKPNFILDSYQVCDFGSCTRNQILYMLSFGPVIGVVNGEANGVFQNYGGGVLNPASCGNINHAVVIAGYDYDSTGGYYIVRNSWGTNWGEKGYYRIRFNNTTQTCKMDSAAWRPIVKSTINPVPPPPPPACVKFFSLCGLQGTTYDVCQSSPVFPNFNGLVSGYSIGNATKVRLFTDFNCRGSSFTYNSSISCFNDVGVSSWTNSVRSAMIDWDKETPPAGCVWVYDGCCFTQGREEFCNSIPDLTVSGFVDKISAIRLGSGVDRVTLATDTKYYGTTITYSAKDVPCIHSMLDNKIRSIQIFLK
jgi:C1A family cysteine protease